MTPYITSRPPTPRLPRIQTVGNMIADLMRRSVDADVALLNSGTLRADAILAPGLIRLKDLVSMLPFFSDTGAASLRRTRPKINQTRNLTPPRPVPPTPFPQLSW